MVTQGQRLRGRFHISPISKQGQQEKNEEKERKKEKEREKRKKREKNKEK